MAWMEEQSAREYGLIMVRVKKVSVVPEQSPPLWLYKATPDAVLRVVADKKEGERGPRGGQSGTVLVHARIISGWVFPFCSSFLIGRSRLICFNRRCTTTPVCCF